MITPIENNAYEIKHLSVDAEVGDSKVAGFKPKLKMKRWNGECSLNIGFQKCEEEELELETDGQGNITKIKWKVKSDDFELELEYEHVEPREEILIVNGKEHRFIQNELGGLEFSIKIGKKPLVNVLEFPIQTEGLKIYGKQSSLHPDHPTWNNRAFRPENVVGSYPVYHSTRTSFHRSKADAEKYRCGKAFQFYYPYLIDADGWKVRAEDFVIGNGFMTITLPQDFLDNAVYPIVIDPNFGFESVGSSDHEIDADGGFTTIFTSPDVADMIGVSMQVAGRQDMGAANVKMGIWVNSDGGALITNGVTEPVSIPGGTRTFYEASFGTSPDIAANTAYQLGVIVAGNLHIAYDDEGGYLSKADFTNSYASPEAFDWDAPIPDERFSIFCTYSAGTSETAYNTMVGNPLSWVWVKCDYGGAEKCPVGLETAWDFAIPEEGVDKTIQGSETSFSWDVT